LTEEEFVDPSVDEVEQANVTVARREATVGLRDGRIEAARDYKVDTTRLIP